VAEYWGCGKIFEKWRTPEATFAVLKELSRGQPCDITGIRDYRMIDECGGIQWPWPEGSAGDKPPVERRLFEDGCFFTKDHRAKFFFDAPRPLGEPTNHEFPFVLLTGRGSSAQWHTGSRTNKSDVLRALSSMECYVEVNPKDAARLGLAPNSLVRVRSRRASLVAVACVTPTVQPGQVFIPMHYAEVNRLTHPEFDPHSRQPNYKHCAVVLERPDQKSHRNEASK
jgi:assimilatory nitrate reductase catalytic subunit